MAIGKATPLTQARHIRLFRCMVVKCDNESLAQLQLTVRSFCLVIEQ
jgi:hypothetical protein